MDRLFSDCSTKVEGSFGVSAGLFGGAWGRFWAGIFITINGENSVEVANETI